MGTRVAASGPQQKRLVAYLDGLTQAAGHADRHTPLMQYCTGLLLRGECKSIEPMAARLALDDVRRVHQSLHHPVADAPWRGQGRPPRLLHRHKYHPPLSVRELALSLPYTAWKTITWRAGPK